MKRDDPINQRNKTPVEKKHYHLKALLKHWYLPRQMRLRSIFYSFKSLNESKCQPKAHFQHSMMPKKCCHSLITLPHTDVISTPIYRHHIWFGMQFHQKKSCRQKITTSFDKCFSTQLCVITHTIKYTLKYKPPWNNRKEKFSPKPWSSYSLLLVHWGLNHFSKQQKTRCNTKLHIPKDHR